MYLKERQGDHVISGSVNRWTIYGMKFSEIRNPIRLCAGCSSISYFWRMVGGSDWAACDAWSSAHEASLTRDCASLSMLSAVQYSAASATVLYKRCYVHAYVMRLCTHCIRILDCFLSTCDEWPESLLKAHWFDQEEASDLGRTPINSTAGRSCHKSSLNHKAIHKLLTFS